MPQRTGGGSVQTIARQEDPTQALGKSGEERAQCLMHQEPFDMLVQVGCLLWRAAQPTRHLVRSLPSRASYVAPDGYPGIGREGSPSPRIVAQNGSPQAEPSRCCASTSSAPVRAEGVSCASSAMAASAAAHSSTSKRLAGTNTPFEGSSMRWLARPMRWRRREAPLGAPILTTRSTSPQSTPRSSEEVATTARSRPCALLSLRPAGGASPVPGAGHAAARIAPARARGRRRAARG